ncbi:glutamate--tRNA ligase [Candidatus Saccharibacteria bacterium]|jgi:glutamyl-tRNA synthetase|nr:glutamate--tRNA ligase [Candidatus Saccharibacteria bacterium]MBP7834652.1 glutamate--tRNA ligase [Candidatus Saccharibacteria bacterium]
MSKVVTRFAPSPTGYIHVGGIRTALFAWLVARQNQGQFILRLEDTDQSREVSGADNHIISSINNLGLNYDQGPDIGGPHAPYRQSERLEIYKLWADKLIQQGRAYADPYTKDEIESFRQQAIQNKKPFLYRNHRPENPPAWDGKTALRFKSDPKSYKRNDLVMGELITGPEAIDDFIIVKSDGFPTYNFAHIVDDAEMEVSHIIRGQEFLASIPNYLNLYEALGIIPPQMATMPHILGPDGKKKLSKRDNAKDVLDYLRDGYLVETMINFIASLGWNDGTEQEIFTKDELIEKFSLDRVQKSGAKFDEKRLLWMNGQWIRKIDINDLYDRCNDYWPESAKNASKEYKLKVLKLASERLKTLLDLPQLTSFFFEEPTIDLDLFKDNKQLGKLDNSEIINLLTSAKNMLQESNFTEEDITNRLNKLLEETGQKPGILFSLIRISTTWAQFSPGLAESLALLGKDTTISRIENTLNILKQN